MTASIEQREDGGLVIVRKAFEPELMEQYASEQGNHISALILVRLMKPLDEGIITHDTSLELIRSFRKLRTTRRVLGRLLAPEDTATSFTINYQPPESEQIWHQDDTDEPVMIVHAVGDGAFDYASTACTLEEAEQDYQTVALGAGDLLIQLQAGQFHRGRNPSEHPRITTAIWTDPERTMQ